MNGDSVKNLRIHSLYGVLAVLVLALPAGVSCVESAASAETCSSMQLNMHQDGADGARDPIESSTMDRRCQGDGQTPCDAPPADAKSLVHLRPNRKVSRIPTLPSSCSGVFTVECSPEVSHSAHHETPSAVFAKPFLMQSTAFLL